MLENAYIFEPENPKIPQNGRWTKHGPKITLNSFKFCQMPKIVRKSQNPPKYHFSGNDRLGNERRKRPPRKPTSEKPALGNERPKRPPSETNVRNDRPRKRTSETETNVRNDRPRKRTSDTTALGKERPTRPLGNERPKRPPSETNVRNNRVRKRRSPFVWHRCRDNGFSRQNMGGGTA